MNELRRPLTPPHSFASPTEYQSEDCHIAREDFDTLIDTARNHSFVMPTPSPLRIGTRRVSAPPSSLYPVAEHGNSAAMPISHRRQSEAGVPFIGAARSSPQEQEHAKMLFPAWSSRTENPFLHHPHWTPSQNSITPRLSVSSLSTSSSSRYSAYSTSSEATSRTSWRYNPIEAEVAIPHAVQKPRIGDSPPLYPTGSASFDFSTGKSIWC